MKRPNRKNNQKRSVNLNQTQTHKNAFETFENVISPATRTVAGFSNFGQFRRVLTTVDDFTAEPTFKEQQLTSFRYIPFLSYDNYLLNELQEISIHSPTNASILRQKQRMVHGAGLELVARKSILSNKEVEVSENQINEVEAYLEQVNPDGEDFNELRSKVEADLIQYGNAFIHLIKPEGGNTLVQYHVPVSNVRIVKMRKDELTPSLVGVSRYFDSCGFNEVPQYVEEYPIYPQFGTPTLYDGQPMSDAPKGEHSIIHIKETHADFKYWGTPSYLAGKLAAQSEYKINKFNNSQLDNGFMPSGIVQFFGNTTQDKAKLIIDKFRESYTGTGNNSRLVAQFIADPMNAAKFTQLTQAYEGQFLEMFDLAQRQIIIAHEWSPALAGMAIAGQLGNVQQLRTEFEVAKNTVVKHYQDILRHQWFKPMLVTGGEFMRYDWKKLSLQVLPMALIGLLGDMEAAEVMTDKEKRQELGLAEEAEVEDDIEEPTNNMTDANNTNT
jgi:hypothetical protein